MKRTAFYFAIGGAWYFLLEVLFRAAFGHRGAHPVVVVMAGAVCAQVCIADDHHMRPWLNAVLGGISATVSELVVGSIALYVFDERLWHYGNNLSNGIISFKWAMVWVCLCFVVIFLKKFIMKNWR